MIPLDLIARAEITINVSAEKVWDALINPDAIKEYMFGATVTSRWKKGSKISWKGNWKGKPYKDKGVILQIIPKTKLQYSHFSPLSGLVDIPENYHTVLIELAEKEDQTVVSLSQDNNATEEAKEHSEQNWTLMLKALKDFLEE